MADLRAYAEKRDFTRTTEPSDAVVATPGDGLRFVVQQHHASRPHYDFRLEWDGVMKSWAVPKGPSLDPADRRLAVEVEDHPVAYASFEGTIPEGSYGAGTVIVWDRGVWVPEGEDVQAQLDAGRLTFRLEGEKLVGRWSLVRTRAVGKKPSWLLLKRSDGDAVRGGTPIVERQPRSVASQRVIADLEPLDGALRAEIGAPGLQLASPADAPPEGDGWLHEIKLDGVRVLAVRRDGRVTLRTRGDQDWTARFPSVAAAVAGLPGGDLVLDGEVVIFDSQGRSDFEALQRARPDGPFVYAVFDLLHRDGWDLTGVAQQARTEALDAVLAGLPADGPIRATGHVRGQGAAFLREACALGLEGVVSKRADAPYRTGRTDAWRKVRCATELELPIVGYTPLRGDPAAVGALVLGRADEGRLRLAGRVGTGFSDAVRRELATRLDGLRTDTPAVSEAVEGARWVTPSLRAAVRCRGLTAGGKVRQGVFVGLVKPAPRTKGRVQVAGVTLTHPDRELFPGVRKVELAEALVALAPRLLPGIAGRALTLFRCPEGVAEPGFFQKHDRPGTPDAIRVQDAAMFVDDAAGLVALAQIAAVELHVPGVRVDSPDAPDRLVFDLDPGEGVPWSEIVAGAHAVRAGLEALGLVGWVRATGGAGLHVVAPITPGATQTEVTRFCRTFAELFAQHRPDAWTAIAGKDRREGKIFLDWMRNARGATAVASWSPRAVPEAWVAAPLTWDELDPGAQPRVSLRDAVDRGDPWVDLPASARPLP